MENDLTAYYKKLSELRTVGLKIHVKQKAMNAIEVNCSESRKATSEYNQKIAEKKRIIALSKERIAGLENLSKAHAQPLQSLTQAQSRITSTTQNITHQQRKIIQSLIKIFRLRRFNRHDNLEDYRILAVGFDMTLLEIDAAIGYIASFVSALLLYLNINIPTLVVSPLGPSISWNGTKHLLNLQGNSTERFMRALGLLNYVIMAIGCRVGVKLEAETTLKNLATLCMEFGKGEEISFDADLEDVIREMSDYVLL